ncbi:NADH-quinone oxidoreductase subunit A [Hufsiella ginkgonis]|uniref:NADH-quinone oxidoreductase subunit A n=1 Tax=Hufsiella ginkgonis TaxID=2695274 RepID=A0A7K1XZ39_9SPHI|nr:NADH-quinone oxidoreductase subunit A [Hufsiella ginkgonis]MXV16271.1 NAD(P)H-quinone oxidoreductase subunit 3 [Hufsiella ginkgonis]
MSNPSQVTEFGKILLFLITGSVFVLIAFFTARLLSPRKPTPEKLLSYECGEEPTGSSWIQFNPRFYVIALVFLLFDVEMVFIFPWSTIYAQQPLLTAEPAWGWLCLTEMMIFVGILLLGLIYVWKKGDLEWVKPAPITPEVKTGIPPAAYDRLNQQTYQVRKFDAPVKELEHER